MSVSLIYKAVEGDVEISLPTSKSISNRLLIAQALSTGFEIEDLSAAKDTKILQEALASDQKVLDVGMAGTAYRFLTAYFSILKGSRILTGEERMKLRPVKILVDELIKLGAEIEYLEQAGYPPLKIVGKDLQSQPLEINGSISSQYITALLLIAPQLKNGLKINLISKVVSLPYIDLTIHLMQALGINAMRKGNSIEVKAGQYQSEKAVRVEADWSSAAFFYQWVAFTQRPIKILGLTEQSIQGDRNCVELFEKLGVQSTFYEGGVLVSSNEEYNRDLVEFDMEDCPDLIPSIAVVSSQLVEQTTIHGVSTLRIKESDRVEALKLELNKLGVTLEEEGEHTIHLSKSKNQSSFFNKNINFEVYNDHRMAMCFAPLISLYSAISISDIQVVEKSFPFYWEELKKVGAELAT